MSVTDPPVRVLDITRLLRRAGRVATGIDRVEAAYLDHLLQDDVPLYGLARTSLGYALLDRQGMEGFRARVAGEIPWGPPDMLSQASRRLGLDQKQAQADLRRLSVKRCLPQRLGRMLMRQLPAGVAYFNVGHSNLTDRVLHALKRLLKARVAVMIHDTIPLDFPQYQRLGSVDPFERMLERVRRNADLILCNSHQTQVDVERHMAPNGAVPDCAVLPLGVDIAAPKSMQMPEGFEKNRPYFVMLGTIEPRKNHALMLDIWDEMSEDVQPPQLLICGNRGWNNESVFARLDDWAGRGGPVFELQGLNDGQVARLLQRSAGLLFPSHAEGYGLPPLEALALGAPVLCADLPVCHELLGENAVYADVNDRYAWQRNITMLATCWQADKRASHSQMARFVLPSWEAHFNKVFKLAL
ncbi:glycosyltransferase, family [Thalassovita gelatinovora]|uniref:Glycosyltransferase, family n=1 Tax=Thalassovita gelatinovora TaxID=53501 RepID=A0A0P1F9P5_THAGE|nr:glycosyltransferase family 1 protein [Thalassovita gelatinovora]QIZ81110.1 glycosyltransferase family 4 protein [Thalassovita gelatinovora]CUH64884.1 glycosyltransferase, family [Thalassovita gelatinovora]SEP90173.1 Glycosyltransferase involved in cell wall bisynthesis [Thalassovita gelatinovora]